jgi:hypothetical protein
VELGLRHIDEWPFGKYKGKPMKDLPTEYLTWVVYESNIQGIPYKWAMQELDKREAILVGDNNVGFPTPQDMSEDW